MASELGNRRRALIFGIELGDTLAEIDNEDAMVARHRRLGFFASTDDIPDLLADERTLLENALRWTWSGR